MIRRMSFLTLLLLVGCDNWSRHSATLHATVSPNAVKLSYQSKQPISSVNQGNRPWAVVPHYYSIDDIPQEPQNKIGLGAEYSETLHEIHHSTSGEITISMAALEHWVAEYIPTGTPERSGKVRLYWLETGDYFPLDCTYHFGYDQMQEKHATLVCNAIHSQ